MTVISESQILYEKQKTINPKGWQTHTNSHINNPKFAQKSIKKNRVINKTEEKSRMAGNK